MHERTESPPPSDSHRPRTNQASGGPGGMDPEDLARMDADLRLVLAQIAGGDYRELAWWTGIVVHDRKSTPDARPQTFPLVLELTDLRRLRWTSIDVRRELEPLGVMVTDAAYRELDRKGSQLRRVPGRLLVDPFDPGLVVVERRATPVLRDDGERLTVRLHELLGKKCVGRLALAAQHLPCLDVAVGGEPGVPAGIGVPADRKYTSPTHGTRKLTGKGVVVGIIDDGCPFAHHDFVRNRGSRRHPKYRSRVVRLWDQTRQSTAQEQARGWSDVSYGREITAGAIDAALNLPVHAVKPGRIDERAVYDYLGYPIGEPGDLASHGGRVMDIAAGHGRSLLGHEGIAPDADIVFVQLPQVMVTMNPAALSSHIIDALTYISDYASAKGKPAVINLSYGGYSGAHDGTTAVEVAIDQLSALRERVVVVSAGNGFEADCHVTSEVAPLAHVDCPWNVKFADPTANTVEVWYNAQDAFEVALTAPDGTAYGPFKAPVYAQPLPDPVSGATIGSVDHALQGNGSLQALVSLRPTEDSSPSGFAPAPAGEWTLTITNSGAAAGTFHAWIRRDDLGPLGARRQQSRFDPEQAHPGFTIGDTASGRLSVSVGAYNRATREIGRYSAAGPTRTTGAGETRHKPDLSAPAEAVPHGGGVLAASSARAQPTRFGGTSAAAPHVTGMVALIFEYARFAKRKLGATAVLAGLSSSAPPNLVPNFHQQAARYPRIKQDALASLDVIGRGPVDFKASMDALFP